MDDEPPGLTVVSHRSDQEIERDRILHEIEWPTREFVANLFRVIRGAGRPYALVGQLFELAKVLANAHDKVSAWEVNQAFECVLDEALPDWEAGDDARGDLHTAMRGSLQIIASNLLFQTTQQAAGRSEMRDGINRIIERREERRRQEEEEYRAAVRSLRPAPKKRKAAKRKAVAKRATTPPPAPKSEPPEPEPKPQTTWDYMRINRKRLREGKEPL